MTIARAPSLSSASWFPAAVTLLLLTLFFCLAGIGLEQEAYWADEVFTLRIARMPWSEFWPALRADSVHPPLHYIASKLVLSTTNEALLSLRWLSILAGAGALLCLCRAHHFLAALLVATNAWFIHYSQEVRGYAFLFLGFSALLYALERNKPAGWIFAAVLWMSWSHYYGILYALAALLVYRERWKPILCGLASLLPWALYVAPRFLDGQVSRQLGWLPPVGGGQFLRYFSRLGFGRIDTWLGAIFFCLLLCLAFSAWRAQRKPNLLWAATALLPPLSVFLVAQIPFFGPNFFYYRYFLASLLPSALLLSDSHLRARFLVLPLALFVCLPYTIEMRRASARFDSIQVARDLQSTPHPPVYAWDAPFNAAPINLYCQPACVAPQPKSLDELPPKFWLLSWPEDRDLTEFDWRRAMRLRGYSTRSIRLYPRRPDFQLHALEIVEYTKP